MNVIDKLTAFMSGLIPDETASVVAKPVNSFR